MGSFVESFVEKSDYKFNVNNVDRVKLGMFLDNMIFENHDIRIFNILDKSDRLFKYKYSNGVLLIDKVFDAYKDCLINDVSLSDYYSRLIFNILKKNEYRENKVKSVLSELRSLKSKVNNSDVSFRILSLIDNLCILSNSNISDIEKNNYQVYLMRNYDISRNFSKSIERIDDMKFSSDCSVVDFRDKKIITMDHKFKVAFDDAISIEKMDNGNYLFGIYITDVSSFVGMESSLYEHAKQRGESIYGDDKNKFYLPMFPRDLTKYFFSLNQGEDKYSIAYLFEFSSNFDFVSSRFCNALINVNKNYTFDNLNKIKSNDSNYDTIYLLMKLTDSLKSEFSSDYHHTKENIKANKKVYNNSLGMNIISTSTIFLNTYIAEMFNNKYPYIYRVNNSDVSTSLINDCDLEKIIKGSTLSSYSVNCQGHPVNGYRPYGHITNPIRNFASYMNQYIFSNLFLKNMSEMEKQQFCEKIISILPDIVDDLNDRLYKNQEFLDIYSELDGNGLCNYKKFKKHRKPLTRLR